MGRFAAVLVAALTMTSCGGTDPPPPTGPLDTGFAKIWNGVPTVACVGFATFTYPATPVEITVSGNSLTARLLCTVGSGISVTATGSGSTATWAGSLSCPLDVPEGCPSGLVFTHTSRTYTLNANGTLTVSGTATMSCSGGTTDCTTSFPGT
jgi:hypothetical protein